MQADVWLKIGPLLGGGVVLAICLIYVLRNPNISNAYASLLAFGGLLFAIPTFASIDIEKQLAGSLSSVKIDPDEVRTEMSADARILLF